MPSKVAFIMIDGLRPDAITAERCPNLTALMARGSSTLTARSVMPCVTLPCHTSIFYGVSPARHGITNNTWKAPPEPMMGLIELAFDANLRAVSIHNWEPLRAINRPETLWMSYYRNNSYVPNGDTDNAHEAVRIMNSEKPDFAFIYLGNVDIAGHYYGWMSDGYLKQAATADEALGIILPALDDYTLIIQADHGGHDHDHGTDTPEDMAIPWIAVGKGIREGYTIQSPVSLLDTAPTIAYLIGLTAPTTWEGRLVDEILVRP